MTTPSPGSSGFIDLVLAVCEKAPHSLLSAICAALKTFTLDRPLEEILAHLPASTNSDLYFLLKTCLQAARSSMTWSEIGWSLEIAAALREKHIHEQTVEITWTGPSVNTFPIRRIDQVLYDLILEARRHILLITFAAARIERLKAALRDASKRGVRICLVLEFDDESEGQLSRSAIEAFAGSIEDTAEIYCWPLDKRERNIYGRPGKLHAKCAVIDEATLISSANLTDDAFNRNMELGVLIRGGDIPARIKRHIEELIQAGVLVAWRQ